MPRYHQLLTADVGPATLRDVLGVDQPVFRLATAGQWLPSGDAVLAALQTRSDPTRRDDTVLLEGPGSSGSPPVVTAPGTFRILDHAADTLAAEVSLPTPGYAVFLDNDDPDWRGYVDDQPATILHADFLGKALAVPEGEHRVRFEYRPWPYLLAFWGRA